MISNIHDHRIDITGQDWSGAFRADGDYIAWRHVEPIVEANKTLLEALQRILPAAIAREEPDSYDQHGDISFAEAAIAKAKGATP